MFVDIRETGVFLGNCHNIDTDGRRAISEEWLWSKKFSRAEKKCPFLSPGDKVGITVRAKEGSFRGRKEEGRSPGDNLSSASSLHAYSPPTVSAAILVSLSLDYRKREWRRNPSDEFFKNSPFSSFGTEGEGVGPKTNTFIKNFLASASGEAC